VWGPAGVEAFGVEVSSAAEALDSDLDALAGDGFAAPRANRHGSEDTLC
jgi:hypothetical protein